MQRGEIEIDPEIDRAYPDRRHRAGIVHVRNGPHEPSVHGTAGDRVLAARPGTRCRRGAPARAPSELRSGAAIRSHGRHPAESMARSPGRARRVSCCCWSARAKSMARQEFARPRTLQYPVDAGSCAGGMRAQCGGRSRSAPCRAITGLTCDAWRCDSWIGNCARECSCSACGNLPARAWSA